MQIKSRPEQDARAEIPGLEPGFSSAPPLGIPEGFGKPRQSELDNTAWLTNSRCIRSSRRDPDYAIFLPQIVSFRIGGWVSNTVSIGLSFSHPKHLPLSNPFQPDFYETVRKWEKLKGNL